MITIGTILKRHTNTVYTRMNSGWYKTLRSGRARVQNYANIIFFHQVDNGLNGPRNTKIRDPGIN